MKRIKLISVVLIILLIGGISLYKYTYQEHKNIESSNVDFKITALELSLNFGLDAQKAFEKYVNKVIVVSGDVSELNTESVMLNSVALCYFPNGTEQVKQGSLIIKGRCIGYDDLLEVVKLDQCFFEE